MLLKITMHTFQKYYFNNLLLVCEMIISLQDQIQKLDLNTKSNKTYASASMHQTLDEILPFKKIFHLFILPLYYLKMISFPF
jgi:hypothetical protein